MKIAVPTRNNELDDHFGHCAYYTLFTIDTHNKILDTEQLDSPAGCGCKSNIIPILKNKGVEVMLAGNMGQGAANKLAEAGISLIRGCSGNVQEVVDAYLKDQIKDSGETCHQHKEGHNCKH